MAATAALMMLPGAASAAIPDVFDGAVTCTERPDGTRLCGSDSPRSTVEAFDGVPIDVNVAFPDAPASGPDGDFPLVMIFHGYGGGKIGFDSMQEWLDRGYATFSMTDRGFHQSCGAPNAQSADPAGCADGYVRLIDNRYEVRDAQDFAARLADEGLIDPQRIGATGGSYGGGMSMALAALRDRQVMPDGNYVPWESPDGKAMEIAVATPFITWSDLAYSLTPNGSTLDYVSDAPYRGRFGVMKESLVNGLYVSGLGAEGFYAPEGTPGADLRGWRARLLEGEPYDGDPEAEAILREITTNHSSYYIDHDRPPAPLLLANSFTDDLFPVDEMVRFYNRTRTEHPDADISLFAAEINGHPRSTSKADVNDRLAVLRRRWFAYYLKDRGAKPRLGVETYTQTCPSEAPSGGPYKAANWARIAKGEVRTRAKRERTIAADAGDPAIAAAFNPVGSEGACAETDAGDEPGTVRIGLDPAPAGGLTLMGSPTVIADFALGNDNSQVAARLLDVGPDGRQTLVARGLWRPEVGAAGRQVFQLHPNGWTFEQGHVPTLELLPDDWNDGIAGGYGRKSDGQAPVTVSDVEVRLPVVERPGSTPGLVKAPAERLVPDGYQLARDFIALGDPRVRLVDGPLKVRRGKLRAGVKCPQRFDSCNDGKLVVKKAKGKRTYKVAKGRFTIAGGESEKLSLKLSKRAKRYFRNHDGMRTKSKVSSAETRGKKKQGRKARRAG